MSKNPIANLEKKKSGLIQLVRDFEPTEFRTNVLGLAKSAAYFNAPSILTTSFDTGPNGPIVKELTDTLPNAPLIRRPGQVNAMDNEDFANAVKATGKKQVVLRYLSNHVVSLFLTRGSRA